MKIGSPSSRDIRAHGVPNRVAAAFTRNREPLGVDIVIDLEKSGTVVRDFGLELLGSPYRPLSGG